ncbi:ATP-dependent RNA helicase DDX24 [Dendroctonus ponderosae]|uniref:ATP-dependent RNA helicase n=1 Tax=Dendroctonus ponderosae TaxID=77166 RepID=U4U591_DENPD|nr:ATP-dependent RNA helicase DDX24 [Dendroctonus ponderosae]ERL87493.1 hypothetical protein D910_04885 [Dendroctonus ponderosae]
MALAAKKWNPIQLDGALFSSALAEGLVGIEECTDYDSTSLITPGKKRKAKTAKTQSSKKLKEVKTEIECIPATAQPSMEAWSSYSLPSELLRALQEQGFSYPTEIQAHTLPAALLGRRDILGAAETGSGKTLAFGLPILSGIMRLREAGIADEAADSEYSESEDEDIGVDEHGMGCVNAYKLKSAEVRRPLYALILTPTRELAMQVKNHLTKVAKYTGINIAVVVGGMAAVKQERLLRKGPEIVVGTPGRLWELIQQGNEHLSQIDNIKFLAIDETDRMLEKGHFMELHDLLEKMNLDQQKKSERQNFVFSATLTLIHDIPKHLVLKRKIKGRKLHDMTADQKVQKIVNTLGITNPKIVDLSQGKGTSGTLSECRITCDIEEKDYYVFYFLKKHPGRTLIFCNSIGCVKRLTNLLGLLNCSPLPLHASMQQRQRLKNLEKFTETENSILIATDVAARGLDIPEIDHVLHYQTPRTSESYVHRSGRTARASVQGLTILLMEPSEFTNYMKMCKTLGKDNLPPFPVQDKYLSAVKERVNLARQLDKLQLQVRKFNAEEGWLQKAAREMDIVVDGLSKESKGDEMRACKALRKQLDALLGRPIFPAGLDGKVQESAIEILTSSKPTFKRFKKRKIEHEK